VPTTQPRPAFAEIAQPSAAHPITIIQIGDSLGEDLGIGLQDVIGGEPAIRLETLAKGDTGLADEAYYNWPAALHEYLAQYHPSIVVVFLGGNDCQPFTAGTTNVTPVALGGSAAFDVAYSARVGDLMSESTSAGAHVLWVGMPIMAPGAAGESADTFSNCMAELNAAYAKEAALHPGVTFVSSWKLFEDPGGQYAEYLDIDGNLGEVRDSDGIHIDGPAGTDLIAGFVVKAMEADYHIKL
jgi:hypothetical protein